MYLLLGLLTVILGILVFFLVPANPMKAKFLHNEEKVALIEHIKINQTGIVNKRFHPQQVVQGLFDLGIWFLGIIVVLQLVSGGLTLFYSVTMLNGFGYSAERSALLNMPVGAINLVTMFLFAIFVRFWGMRWVVVSFAGIISAIGAALLFGLTSYGDDKRALLAGLYLISFTSGATMITVYWLSCNVAGVSSLSLCLLSANSNDVVPSLRKKTTKQIPQTREKKTEAKRKSTSVAHQASICRGSDERGIRPGRHYRSADFPTPSCAGLSVRENGAGHHDGCNCCVGSAGGRILLV